EPAPYPLPVAAWAIRSAAARHSPRKSPPRSHASRFTSFWIIFIILMRDYAHNPGSQHEGDIFHGTFASRQSRDSQANRQDRRQAAPRKRPRRSRNRRADEGSRADRRRLLQALRFA